MNQLSVWRSGLRLFLMMLVLGTCGGCVEYGSDGYYVYFYLPTILGVGLFFVAESVFITLDKRKTARPGDVLPSEKHRFAVAFPLIAGILWFVSLLLGVPLDSFFFWYLFFLPALTVAGTLQYMGASETGVNIAFVVGPIAQYVGYGIVIDRLRWTRNPGSRARWLAATALCLLAFVLWFTIEPYPAEPDTTPGALGLPVVFAIHGTLIALLLWRAIFWWRLAPRTSDASSSGDPGESKHTGEDEGNST